MFAKDVDLARLEPQVFGDVVWAGQRRVRGAGGVSGSTLTLTTFDTNFAQGGVDAGMVVSVNGVPHEVIERTSATTLTISRVRASDGDDPITPAPITSGVAEVMSFANQIGAAHAQVLAMLGLAPGATDPASGEIAEDRVLNPRELAPLEAAAALQMVYGSASVLSGSTLPIAARASYYRRKFDDERQRARAIIDTDGDGVGDATRRPNVVRFARG
ncbi:MAG: hypothetical protein RBS39_07370 [Phycisphaerales bacterium]|jgi:hypothetical protein|nr:hypothetical protein [Phycisphaerales bacterium]